MNILIINGSPRGKNSNTWQITQAFVEGLSSACNAVPPQIEFADLNRMDVRPCRGCFSCWRVTPGTCVIKDDMTWILEKTLWADIVIWSFPLYYFYVPGPVKTMIDRRLPLTLPDIIPDPERPGLTKHPPRYDLSGQRNVLVSTCGFYKPDGIYGDVISLFDRLYGKGKYETIFCGEGELFRVPPMKPRIDEYLSYARCAGKEFANGAISVQTKGKLQELLLAQDRFEKMANTSWKQ